jgi:cell wall-associated NlpC family hydrolase
MPVSTAERAAAAAYVRSVLAIPYREDGNGPEEFGCWGLSRDCQQKLFGRELPVAGHPDDIQAVIGILQDPRVRDGWPEVERPEHGALAVFSKGQRRHVGVWLDVEGGGVLHTIEGAGVQFQSWVLLQTQGWGRLRFHAWRGRPT